ncbi:hypothetical protein EH105704_01_05890 [Atlantibacter hermannii NBRC 105704]|uniref:Uncharacterized protein n=1 Tax=Atlantibacter hermannii NBRC 105704 TaxID=1115512 RepID=H5UXE8_ATLHE|nr:hypothetical protein EH105704_01_05890 [Atlantibacter hermannii NBRC 105704]
MRRKGKYRKGMLHGMSQWVNESKGGVFVACPQKPPRHFHILFYTQYVTMG